MTINYKGIELNAPGDPAPWATIEQDVHKQTIDSIVIDTVSGSASDAKVNGHKHFRLYAESTGDLVLSIDNTQKTTLVGDVQIDGDIQATVATQGGFVKNDAAGNLSFGNEGGGGTTNPGGVDTNVQYNSAGSFAGSNRFVYDGSAVSLRNTGLVNTIRLSSDIPQVSLTNPSGDDVAITTNSYIAQQSYVFRPNTPDNTMFFDGFTDDMITGWNDPAEMQIATVTTFNINKAGVAYFIDKSTYPFTKVRRDVPLLSGIVANLGLAGRELHIFVDEAGTIIQQNSITYEDLYTKAYIGNFTKNGAGTELAQVKNRGPVSDTIPQTTRAFLSTIGVIQTENMFVNSAGMGNMQIERTSGSLIDLGINSLDDRAMSDSIDVVSESPVTSIRYRYVNDSNELAFYSDTNAIDSSEVFEKGGGGFENVNANNWSSQRVYYFPARGAEPDTFMVLLGHVEYDNADTALSSIGTIAEDFSKPVALKRAAFLGWIIPRGGASDADDPSDVIFVPYNAPFELSGTGAGPTGAGGTTLQTAYNLSTIPQILTDATRGAVTYKGGTELDTDDVFLVQNNGGGDRFSVKGNGDTFLQRLGVGVPPSELLHVNGGTGVKALITGNDDVSVFIQSTFGSSTPYLALNNGTRQWRLKVDGSDGEKLKIEDNSAATDRFTFNHSDGSLEIGPSSELVLYPQLLRPGNGLPQALLLMQASDWSFELDTSPDTLRIGKLSPAGTEIMEIGGIVNPISQISASADSFRISSSNNDIDQILQEVTPDFKSFRFRYDSNTAGSGAPTNNSFRFNNADPLLATKLFVDHDPLDKPAVMNYILDAIANNSKAYIYNSNRTIEQWYDITITGVTPQTGYSEYDITVNDGANSGLAANQPHGLIFKEPVGGGGGLTTAVASEFYAVPTGTQSMTNGVVIVPNMNNELYDPDGVYDLGTNTFTAPADGLYMFTASTKVSVSAGGQIESYLYVNGGLQTTASGSIDVPGTMVANVAISIELSTNDTLQLRSAQFSGFAGIMQTNETFISGHRIL